MPCVWWCAVRGTDAVRMVCAQLHGVPRTECRACRGSDPSPPMDALCSEPAQAAPRILCSSAVLSERMLIPGDDVCSHGRKRGRGRPVCPVPSPTRCPVPA
eukprot:2838223-Rhodomonas_salina.2